MTTKLTEDCLRCLNVVYLKHNPDPLSSSTPQQLSPQDVSSLCSTAVANEIQKTSRGDGQGMQTIYSGMTAFAEVPVVSQSESALEITQQLNVGNGFAYRTPSTWAKRTASDHMRRGSSTKVADIFEQALEAQAILAEPMKINLKPDWDPTNKNFLNGQQIDAHYKSLNLWSTKGYFAGSMASALCDPRQTSIIIQSGCGVIQSPFGLLPYQPGDLIQIPPNTPFCFYVNKGSVVRCITYYSKENLLFPDKQLNVSDLNQAPFSPSVVLQCKYSFNEASHYPSRPEYVRIEQSDGTYVLYSFPQSRTAFNWMAWVHNGPLVHKVSLIDNFERIGTNKGHNDPNIWLILRHEFDASFGIAFITGTSLIQVGASEGVTYPPAYFHLNGVHEKGEVVLFGNESGGYDARKGFHDGDCLLHPAGVGHGGDKDIYKHFVSKAIVKYVLLLQRNERDAMLKGLLSSNKFARFVRMDSEDQWEKIALYVKWMYAMDFEDVYDDDKSVEANVVLQINNAVDAVVDAKSALLKGVHEKRQLQALGMPFGIGYLLVECRDVPVIPKPRYNSNFRKSTAVSYGMGVLPLVDEANEYIKKLNKNRVRSVL